MALSRHAAKLAGLSQLCTVAGPCDMTRASRRRDVSEDTFTLTEHGRADLAQWRAEHPGEDVSDVYRQWKAAQESPPA